MAPQKSVFQCGSCVALKVSRKAVSEVPGGGPNIQITEKLVTTMTTNIFKMEKNAMKLQKAWLQSNWLKSY